MPTKMYAFWASHDVEHDPPMKSKLQGFFGVGLALLGTIGIFIALITPTMLVVNFQMTMTRRGGSQFNVTSNSYHGYFGECEYSWVQQVCEHALFPPKPTSLITCYARNIDNKFEEDAADKKRHSQLVVANIFALACLALGVATISTAAIRGLGMTRSGMLSAATSFACGLSGCLAMILFYVAVNPCIIDRCSFKSTVGAMFSSCWALSPVLQVVGMLLVLVGGCCAQRWAPNPRARDQNRVTETTDAAISGRTQSAPRDPDATLRQRRQQ